MAGIQEAIRIVLETEGREGIEQLRAALASLGGVSAESVADTNRLLDSLSELNDAAAKMARFEAVSADLRQTTEALDDASRAALQLALQIGETDKPSKEMVRTYKQVRDEVSRLEGVQKEQAATQGLIVAELRRAGVETDDFAQAEASLRTRVQSANQALTEQARAIQEQAQASQRQQAAIAEGEEAFRRQATASRTSAEALKAYRERAAETAAAQREAASESGKLGRALGSIRAIAASAAAALGIGGAVEGIKNLLGIASAAENTRRALQNLYGSQDAGNRAFAALRDMSTRNGIALNTLAETAKKLKSFGLDPLNGSLQALIDQNASVGGSQEDLEGKVLAVGQAWAKQKLQGEEILQLVERGVPVWDLLQKATGKNVEQLQKLSSEGKLGRDVIASLIDEIGRANTGAATAGLTSISGLVAQVSARWTEFAQKVADAGVAEYFKEQVRSLLGSTGNLDDLARRVGQGIVSSMEAVRRFAVDLGTLLKPVGDLTIALAKNAEIVSLLAKIYITTKLTQYAAGLAGIATQARAATIATGELAAAEAARGVGIGRIGAMAAKIPSVLKMTFLAVGLDVLLDGVQNLNAALDYRQEAIRNSETLERAQAALQREQLGLGQQLQQLYAGYAKTTIASAEELRAQTRDQAQDYIFALQQAREYFGGVIREARAAGDAQRAAAAHEQWERLGQAVVAARGHLEELQRTAGKTGAQLAANAAVEAFDKLIAKGKSAQQAINNIFNGLDFTSTKGLQEAGAVIEQIQARGTMAAKALQVELIEALRGVSAVELPKVEAAAIAAFGEGSAQAKAMAAAIAGIRADKLGVDLDGIRTGFTKAGREAVTLFDQMVGDVNEISATAVEKSRAIATAFDNAFRQAGTQKEVEALKASLQRAFSDGSISAAEFQARVAEADAKLRELSGRGVELGENVARGANTAVNALGGVADAAADAASHIERAGDATEDAARKMRAGEKNADGFALALGSVSEEFTRAAMAANRYANSVDNATWRSMVNRLSQLAGEQRKALEAEMEALRKRLAMFDPLTERIEQLRRQYNYLGEDQLRALAEMEQQLADLEMDKAADLARQRAEAAEAAAEAEAAAAASITSRSSEIAAAANEAADAIERASTATPNISRTTRQTAAVTDEIVIRVVSDQASGGTPVRLSSADIQTIASAVLRQIQQSRGLTL